MSMLPLVVGVYMILVLSTDSRYPSALRSLAAVAGAGLIATTMIGVLS